MKKRSAKIKRKHKLRFKLHNIQKDELIIKLLINLFYIYILVIIYPNQKKSNDLIQQEQKNNPNILKEIKSFEEKTMVNLSKKLFDEFYSFNSQNKLIEENVKFEKSYNPEVSVVLTAYNLDRCIHRALRSIQNQSLKNIEIIIVDDCSTDNTAEVIKQYQKEDPRIILIEHEYNESPMKSRSDGIRKAKGEYITIMDGDDAFIHKDILKYSLYIAKKGNLDIIEFNHAMYNDGRFALAAEFGNELNLTNIIYQPELNNVFMDVNKNFPKDFNNRAIWGKLVKNEIFLKALEYIGDELCDEYINWAEDTLMVVAIIRSANSYYFIKEFGYYRNIGPQRRVSSKVKKKVCKVNDKLKDFSIFKFLKFLVSKAGNNEKYQIMAYKEMITGVKYENYLNNFKLSKKHYELLFYIFDEALKFDFLNNQQKEKIRNLRSQATQKRDREKMDNN